MVLQYPNNQGVHISMQGEHIALYFRQGPHNLHKQCPLTFKQFHQEINKQLGILLTFNPHQQYITMELGQL